MKKLFAFTAVVLALTGMTLMVTPIARASSTNALEDSFQRANQHGFGGSTNSDGVTNFGWHVDADGTHSYDTITSDTAQMAYPGATSTPNFAGTGHQYNGGDELAEVSLSSIGSPVFYLPMNFCSDTSCGYEARLDTNNSTIELAKRSGGSTAEEASASFTATAGAEYWIRFNYDGNGSLKMRTWANGTAEPSTWNLSWTDTGTLLGSNYNGLGTSWNASTSAVISIYYYAFSSNPAVPALPAGGSGGTQGNTVTVTNPGNQAATAGTATSLQISASDSASGQALTYTAAGLPAGLSINPSTGLISGTPTTAGSGTVTVTATDTTSASGSATFTWNVSSSSGGTCTANGGFSVVKVDNGLYNLQANEFHSSATLNLTSDCGADFTVSNSGINDAPTDGEPGAYPSLYKGCHWGTCTTSSGLPVTVSQMQAPGYVTTSENTTTVPGGRYDDAYDIWFNSQPSTSANNDANSLEMMIWLNQSGSVSPAGSQVASNVSIGGNNYNIWKGGNSPGGTVSYVLSSPGTSVRNLDLGPLAQDAVNRGYMPGGSSSHLIGVEAGFEIWQGGTSLAVNSFNVCVNGTC